MSVRWDFFPLARGHHCPRGWFSPECPVAGGRFAGKLSLRNQVALVVQVPGHTCSVPHPGKWVRVVRRRGEAVKGVGGEARRAWCRGFFSPRAPLCQVTSLLDLVSSANHLFSDGLQGKGKICMIHPHQISITPHHIKD